jgi:transcriptional regulator with XRE-family HTH domain
MEPTLRTLIDDRGLRQDWIADKLGVSEATFSRWVTGRAEVPIGKVTQFADVLGVKVADIVAASERTYERRTA